GLEVGAEHPRQSAQLLGPPGIALVRHRARALLGAGTEGLLDLANLGALEMADLEGEALHGRADGRARVQELCVAVAGEDLPRRGRRQPQPFADERLDLRIDVRVRPNDA